MDPILPTTAVPPQPPAPAPQPPPPQSSASAKIVYGLYLASLVTGITLIIGVIMAYMNVGDAPEPLRSHYRFQIRTFWMLMLYSLVAGLLTLAVVGVLVFVLVGVWFIVRCVKGLKALDRGEPYPNVRTWLW
jgi:uncharacterized membrane protein